ncbi:alpha-galactosidase [Streptomyces sp. TS71-3]|uniref:alpha-galactosidase n=1 Tax=Streptomyces sp. TS71-3 TaxID=2733862 RepID=UPI001B224ED8|nr:alpha-galactosidase [Streptomyces sp. TS71-3]GHJ42051.1 alpha-galactosidase [Streptomyces sp. TS71-3]
MACVVVDRERRVWTLSTEHTTYALHAAGDDKLVQLHWGARLTSAETARLTGPPFTTAPYGLPLDLEEPLPVDGGLRWGVPSLQVTFPGGVRSLELVLTGDEVVQEDGGARLDLVLADRHFPLRVVLHHRVHEGSDVIERWVTLRHTGTEGEPSGEPVLVHRADSGNWLLPELTDYRCSSITGAWAAETQLQRVPLPAGEFTLTSRHGLTGHHANPWIMVDDGTATEEHGEVWSVALAWSGTWRLTAQRRFEGRAAVTAGFGHDGVTWRLAPGEELSTPPVLGLHTDGGFGAASRAWHRHGRARVLPHPAETRPVLYNSWEAVEFDIDEAGQIALAQKAADLGVELFVMDDGWFGGRTDSTAGLGDWWPNPERFPHGLRPLADKVRTLGMEFGVWVEPEMVNPDSELYRAHPDWVLHHPHRRRDELRTQLVLNFARDDVREWAFGWLDRLVGDHGVTFLKWDMNRALSQAGWPERARSGDGDQDRLWIDHTRNVYAVMDRLRARHPALRIESCAGGGGRVDFGVLARTDEVWTSDNTDAFHRQSIQHGFSQVYPAGVMAAWVTDAARAPLEYRFHVAMAGVLGIGGDLNAWTPQQLDTARRLVAEYQGIRTVVQHGEQYRLGAEPGRGLSAVQYVHGDEVALLLYRPGAGVGPSPGVLRLAGLDPDARYREDDGGPDLSGRTLMRAGLPIRDRLPAGDWASALVRLRRLP